MYYYAVPISYLPIHQCHHQCHHLYPPLSIIRVRVHAAATVAHHLLKKKVLRVNVLQSLFQNKNKKSLSSQVCAFQERLKIFQKSACLPCSRHSISAGLGALMSCRRLRVTARNTCGSSCTSPGGLTRS